MITEDYVSFEVAKLLKEKGFNWPCHGTYDIAVTGGKPKFSEYEVLSYFPYGMKNTDDKYDMIISAPTQSMAMKWLREIHHIILVFKPSYFSGNECTYWTYERWCGDNFDGEVLSFKTYEEAVEAAIKHCLENLI